MAAPESTKISGNKTKTLELYMGQTVLKKKRLQTRNVMWVAIIEEHLQAQDLLQSVPCPRGESRGKKGALIKSTVFS